MQRTNGQSVLRAFDPAFVAPLGMACMPPRMPRQLGGLSGRPGCRIYARDDVWVLELDAPSGGWLDDSDDVRKRLIFPTLIAAVGYAEQHGLDYRIVLARPQRCDRAGISETRRRASSSACPRRNQRRSTRRRC